MRIHVERGDRKVTVDLDGSSVELLEAARAAAANLLGDSDADAEDEPERIPFGFTATPSTA